MAKVNDPIVINGTRVKNRLTMAPTVKFDYAGEDGQLTLRHLVHYLEREEGGIGLICVEATAVTPEGRFAKNHLGLWEDAQIEGHKRINGTPYTQCFECQRCQYGPGTAHVCPAEMKRVKRDASV